MKNEKEEITKKEYWEMMEVLPPKIMTNKGFLIGEPTTHTKKGALYGYYYKENGKYYYDGLKTVEEFQEIHSEEKVLMGC